MLCSGGEMNPGGRCSILSLIFPLRNLILLTFQLFRSHLPVSRILLRPALRDYGGQVARRAQRKFTAVNRKAQGVRGAFL
jgi:hypothetical protein